MKPRLRHCPCCGTDVRHLNLGLRDYAWASTRLPGSIGPMDGDFILERKGKVLIMEFKPDNVALSTGQRMTLRTFQRMGCDVWIVKGDGPVYELSELGSSERFKVTEAALGELVHDWFEEASESEAAVG